MTYFTEAYDAKIIEILNSGGVGLLPTDTIYGLSCLAQSSNAINRIRRLKGLPGAWPFICLISEVRQAVELGVEPDKLSPAAAHWPAPLTAIVKPKTTTPKYLLHQNGTIALRVPSLAPLRELIAAAGPVVSTSANPHGRAPAACVKEAVRYFGENLDFYVDGGVINGRPSTIAKVENKNLKVIRQGAYRFPSVGKKPS